MTTSGTLEMVDVPIPDESPNTDSPFEYACEVCGKELYYGGRGRKPKFCDEHKGGGKGATTRKSTARNDALAFEAAAALSQLNALIGLGLLVPAVPWMGDNPLFLPHTAVAIAHADEGFNAQAYAALQTDPALCKMILRVGSASGKIALIVAYGMLATAVVPIGVEEYKERKKNEDRSTE
jgi:hypothetical protein